MHQRTGGSRLLVHEVRPRWKRAQRLCDLELLLPVNRFFVVVVISDATREGEARRVEAKGDKQTHEAREALELARRRDDERGGQLGDCLREGGDADLEATPRILEKAVLVAVAAACGIDEVELAVDGTLGAREHPYAPAVVTDAHRVEVEAEQYLGGRLV